MIIRYAKKHERELWKAKMTSIFGTKASEKYEPVKEGDYEYIPAGGWDV